jgi:hypothetical protein
MLQLVDNEGTEEVAGFDAGLRVQRVAHRMNGQSEGLLGGC